MNLIYCREKRMVNGSEEETELAWITELGITKNNAEKIVRAGRNRLKIENQVFNCQKRWQGNIEHASGVSGRKRTII